MIEIFKSVLGDVHFLGAFLQSVIVILLGYFFRHYNIVDSAGKKTLTAVVWKMAVPCVAFNSFMQDFNQSQFKTGLGIFFLTFVFYAIIVLVFKAAFIRTGKDKSLIAGLFAAVGQVTLFSMPILQSVYTGRDKEVMLYISMLSIAFRIMVYIISYYLISGEKIEMKHLGASMKKIFVTPIMISMGLGILVYLIQNITPQVQLSSGSYSFLRIDKTLPALYTPVITLSRLLNPLSMFLIGMSIGEADFSEALKDKAAWIAALGRNFVAPVIVLLGSCVIKALGLFDFDEYSLISLVIGFSAPVSVTLSITCMQFHKEEAFASRTCLISTLLCVLTLPFSFVLTYYVLTLPIFG